MISAQNFICPNSQWCSDQSYISQVCSEIQVFSCVCSVRVWVSIFFLRPKNLPIDALAMLNSPRYEWARDPPRAWSR